MSHSPLSRSSSLCQILEIDFFLKKITQYNIFEDWPTNSED
jgi:hypothetical protein